MRADLRALLENDDMRRFPRTAFPAIAAKQTQSRRQRRHAGADTHDIHGHRVTVMFQPTPRTGSDLFARAHAGPVESSHGIELGARLSRNAPVR